MPSISRVPPAGIVASSGTPSLSSSGNGLPVAGSVISTVGLAIWIVSVRGPVLSLLGMAKPVAESVAAIVHSPGTASAGTGHVTTTSRYGSGAAGSGVHGTGSPPPAGVAVILTPVVVEGMPIAVTGTWSPAAAGGTADVGVVWPLTSRNGGVATSNVFSEVIVSSKSSVVSSVPLVFVTVVVVE